MFRIPLMLHMWNSVKFLFFSWAQMLYNGYWEHRLYRQSSWCSGWVCPRAISSCTISSSFLRFNWRSAEPTSRIMDHGWIILMSFFEQPLPVSTFNHNIVAHNVKPPRSALCRLWRGRDFAYCITLGFVLGSVLCNWTMEQSSVKNDHSFHQTCQRKRNDFTSVCQNESLLHFYHNNVLCPSYKKHR